MLGEWNNKCKLLEKLNYDMEDLHKMNAKSRGIMLGWVHALIWNLKEKEQQTNKLKDLTLPKDSLGG